MINSQLRLITLEDTPALLDYSLIFPVSTVKIKDLGQRDFNLLF